MPKSGLVYVGTYSEPILFGTGQVLQGKGKGIYCFRFDPERGALDPGRRHRGRAQLVLPRLRSDAEVSLLRQRVQGIRGQGERRGQRVPHRPEDRRADLPQHEGQPRHRPLPPVVDPTGRNVLIANFASGSVCVLPIQRGRLARRRERLSSSTRDRASIRGGRPARTPTPSSSPPTTALPLSPSSASTR